jgi:hypothetical protein
MTEEGHRQLPCRCRQLGGSVAGKVTGVVDHWERGLTQAAVERLALAVQSEGGSFGPVSSYLFIRVGPDSGEMGRRSVLGAIHPLAVKDVVIGRAEDCRRSARGGRPSWWLGRCRL